MKNKNKITLNVYNYRLFTTDLSQLIMFNALILDEG